MIFFVENFAHNKNYDNVMIKKILIMKKYKTQSKIFAKKFSKIPKN